MPTFRQGNVVRVPFPYADQDTRQHRPALVVSVGGIGRGAALVWVVMITSAENHRWPGDVPLDEDHREVGLPVPSLIRTSKIATIDARHAVRLGMLPPARWSEVAAAIRGHLAL